MKNGLDFAAKRNPTCNGNFLRRWNDDPLDLQDFQRLGDVAPKVVEDVGRRAIGRWLDKASQGHGAVAAEAFRQADSIRRKLGLGWEDLIGQGVAA